jgi:crossover junction endodeoxyribonuclease RuvC
MNIIGIDPGKSGAIALLSPSPEITYAVWIPMPISGGEIDVRALYQFIKSYGPDLAVVEKVHAMPGNSSVSMFSFGKSYGIVLGVLGALGVRVELVAPQAWKKVVLAGSAKDKEAAIAYCRRAFPAVSLLSTIRCTKPHDGAADALCIARYGAMTFGVL